jgi:ubiquinone/menaquinone biosynthesis C-methylase UbiE
LRLSKRFKNFFSNILYSILASKYDLISYLISRGYWYRWQLKAMKYIKGNVVLDVACGTGRFMETASDNGHLIFGIDRSMYMLKAYKGNSIDSNMHFIQADYLAIPFKKEIFDAITITFPTQIVLDNKLYEEVYRVLKSKGRIIIIDFPNLKFGFINSLLNILINLLDQKTIYGVLEAIPKNKFKIMLKNEKDSSSNIKIIIADKLY